MPMHREWVDLHVNGVAIDTASPMTPIDILFDMREEVNKTVTRLILGLDLHIDDININVQAQAKVALGIGIATTEGFDQAIVAPIGESIPQPQRSVEFPIHGWLWRGEYLCQWSNSATFGVEVSMFPRIDLDLRAARKVDKGILYLAAFNSVVQGAMDVELTGQVRALMLVG